MYNITRYPDTSMYAELCERPHLDVSQLNTTVAGILSDIRERGDEAVMEYEARFDKATLSQLAVTTEEIDEAMKTVDAKLLDAIKLAHDNIQRFHASQKFEGEKNRYWQARFKNFSRNEMKEIYGE